jgi:signal peptidase
MPGEAKIMNSSRKKALTLATAVLLICISVTGIFAWTQYVSQSNESIGAAAGRPVMVFGFSAQNVLSGSMQNVYPKGSVILIKHVDPNTLAAGDDINFEWEENVTWTHRIKEVIKNFEGSGQPGFRTYGTTSGATDDKVIRGVNVLGKVIFCVPKLGVLVGFISNNIILALVIFFLLIALSFILPSLIKSCAESPYSPRLKQIAR